MKKSLKKVFPTLDKNYKAPAKNKKGFETPHSCSLCSAGVRDLELNECPKCDKGFCNKCFYDYSGIDEWEFEDAAGFPLEGTRFDECPECLAGTFGIDYW